jgi:hypothetical protein
MQRESIKCLVMAWHALTVRCSSRFGNQLRYIDRALLIAHPLITARTPPRNRLRFFHFKLEYHVCLTCLHPNRENQSVKI